MKKQEEVKKCMHINIYVALEQRRAMEKSAKNAEVRLATFVVEHFSHQFLNVYLT